MNLSEFAVKRRTLILFFAVLFTIAGVQAWLRLGRAEDPSFTFKVMTISVAWPGATAEEMTTQVTDRLEKTLQEVPYFDYVKSYSAPGEATLFVTLRDSTPARAVPDCWYQVRKKIGDMAYTLPQGVQGPVFNDEFGDVFGSIYAFHAGDGWTDADLKRTVEDARNRLLRVPDVAKAQLLGVQDQKIFVEFSHVRLASLGVTPQQIFDSLSRQNAVTPAGSVETGSDRVYLRVTGGYRDVDAIAATPVQAGGRVLRLGDVATVTRGTEDPKTEQIRVDGKPAYEIAISMAKGGDILRLGRNLAAEIAHIRADLPAGMEVVQVTNQPKIVQDSIAEFTEALAEAIGIVLAVSFVTLGMRTGAVVALSVPLVLAITFVIMQIIGVDLQRISLGALIIALGLLVDDAIIAAEMMVVKLEAGWTRLRAATFAYTSTARPMLTGTLVTAAGFVPVGFARSAAGEYTTDIFWVTAIALLVSWLVAVMFTPVLGTLLLREHKGPVITTETGHAAQYDRGFYLRVRRLIAWCVDHKRVVVAATIVLFGGSMAAFTLVQQQFFPTSGRLELMVDLTLREGSSFSATDAQVAAVERLLHDDPDAEQVVAYVGTGAPRFFLSLDQQLPRPSFAQLVVTTPDLIARERLRARLMAAFETGFPDVLGRVTRLELGPPVGYPVSFRVMGPDPERVRAIAGHVRDEMRHNPLVRNVNLDWDARAKAVRLEVDQDRLRLLGLTPSDIARSLQTLLSGTTVTQYREGIEAIDVVARAVPGERVNLDRLPDLSITTASGVAVPLSQVARLVPMLEEPRLWRRTRDIVIFARADVVDGVQAPDVTAQIAPTLRPIIDSLPAGYRIETAGAVEESAKGQASIYAMFPIMLVLMVSLLMIQLQGVGKTALVVLTAPLGLIGVSMFLLILRAPFGFVATLGVIALAGMIMRNSVILIDQIDHDLKEGASAFDAVVESTVRRARPIVLTALAAVLAMIPLSRSIFWGPMAIAIMGGLFVATFLTLLYLPALYAMWFGVKRTAPAASATRMGTVTGLALPAE